MNNQGASYVSSDGDSGKKRVRDLTNIGTFETRACYKGQGLAQVTIWFQRLLNTESAFVDEF